LVIEAVHLALVGETSRNKGMADVPVEHAGGVVEPSLRGTGEEFGLKVILAEIYASQADMANVGFGEVEGGELLVDEVDAEDGVVGVVIVSDGFLGHRVDEALELSVCHPFDETAGVGLIDEVAVGGKPGLDLEFGASRDVVVRAEVEEGVSRFLFGDLFEHVTADDEVAVEEDDAVVAEREGVVDGTDNVPKVADVPGPEVALVDTGKEVAERFHVSGSVDGNDDVPI
jgi:hypothetical protein